MDDNYKWIRPDMSLTYIGKGSEHIITVANSGNLADDFYTCATGFFEAAECVIHYLGEEAAENRDISKLDIWYFAMIYLYRQCLELLLKAALFRAVNDSNDRKTIIREIRHDLKQGLEILLAKMGLTYVESENMNWLYKFFSDISRIDKESDMFRYPFGSNMQTLFEDQTRISLVATHDNMNKAYNILKDIFETGNVPDKKYEASSPQLIIEGGHYYQQSVVGYTYHNQAFYPFYSSYEEVGAFLKNRIVNGNKTNYFMPMCYMYRNAVELGLKRIILEDSHIDREKALRILKRKKHSILGLWNCIADEIEKYANAADDDTTMADTQKYIQAFHDFDSTSDLFRYPCDKNLNIYFLIPQKFDVANVSSCFQELCNFLDGVDSMLSAVKDFEAEMASDYLDY